MTAVVNARLKPSRTRRGRTYDFHLDALPGSLTVNELPDGRPAEIFLKAAKQGSTLAGLCEALSITTSLALQHGTPVVDVVCRMINARFEPSGRTGDPDVPVASSLSDYIARRLAVDYLSPGQLVRLGLLPPVEATAGGPTPRDPARRPEPGATAPGP